MRVAAGSLAGWTPPATASAAPRHTSASAVAAALAPMADATIGAVLGALGDAGNYQGRKHAIVGALGGVLRRLGWRREQCAELVRAWIDGHATDTAAGVAWACGAWDRPAEEVSGMADLEALLGHDHAALVAHVALGRTGAGRERYAPAVVERTPPSATDAIGPWYDGDDYDDTPPEYACVRLGVVSGKVTCINGSPSGGKTVGAIAYGVHAALGREWCGCTFAEPVPTLYLAHEGALMAKRKRARLCRSLGVDARAVPFYIRRARGPLTAEALAALDEFVREQGVKQIIVDTLTSANRGMASMKDAEYADLVFALGDLSEACGVAVVLLTHAPKDAREGISAVAGTFAIAAAAQCVWTVTSHTGGVITWRNDRAPEEDLPGFGVVVSDDPAPDGADDDPKWGLTVREASAAEVAAVIASEHPERGVGGARFEQAVCDAGRSIHSALLEYGGGVPHATAIQKGGKPHGQAGAANEAIRRLRLGGAIRDSGGVYYAEPKSGTALAAILAGAVG